MVGLDDRFEPMQLVVSLVIESGTPVWRSGGENLIGCFINLIELNYRDIQIQIEQTLWISEDKQRLKVEFKMSWDWRDDSEIKSACCSYGGTEFSSQNLLMLKGSQSSITPGPRELKCSFGISGHLHICKHTERPTHTHSNNKISRIINFKMYLISMSNI